MIDPKRVCQANTDVSNAMFLRLENYIKLLYRQGKIEWSSFKDIPAENVSNMDKLGVNTHNHRHKIIAPVSAVIQQQNISTGKGRVYQETSAGDSKIPMHATLALTSQPHGMLNCSLYFI